MSLSFSRLGVAVATAAAALLGGASPALASHLQGGSIFAEVTAAGQLKGTLTYAAIASCTVGQQSTQNITVVAPTNQTANVSVPVVATRCITGSATYKGDFEVPLDTSKFSLGAPDGQYLAYWTSSARTAGILNLANSSSGSVRFETKVRKVAMQATAAPKFGSNVANGIGIGTEYVQNLNASDPDGGTVGYQTLTKPGDVNGPDSDVITLDQTTGRVSIPAATTATYTGGNLFIYKVRATDAQGDYSERDVLLKVASSNAAPTITGLDASYSVKDGGQLTIPFTATDPNGGDTVKISTGTLPSWVTVNTTPGNPATGTLVANPPAGVSGTFGINLDAEDDSNDVVLTGAAYTEIKVVAPVAAKPTITSSPAAVARTATFTFTGGESYECRIDGGAWVACASPYTPTGLADGTHTFEVRSNGSEPAQVSFTLDSTAPAAPTVLAGPNATTSDKRAQFTFTGEPGATFECRFDGGAFAPCTSPVSYDKLKLGKHTFEVRQTDLAGNVSALVIERFTVVDAKLDVDTRSGKGSKATPVLSSTVSAANHSAQLGCRVPGAAIKKCVIKAYATVNGKKVLIGTGTTTGTGKSERVAVKVKLNARGRALVNRVGGVKTSFQLDATTGDSRVRAKTVARMLPSRTLVVPGDGLFASGSAELSERGRRYIRALAPQLKEAKALTCVGHTDAVGSPELNKDLGQRRAEAVCAYVRKLGVKAKWSASSAGETRPRATNATDAGRSLNRRVEIDVDYR